VPQREPGRVGALEGRLVPVLRGSLRSQLRGNQVERTAQLDGEDVRPLHRRPSLARVRLGPFRVATCAQRRRAGSVGRVWGASDTHERGQGPARFRSWLTRLAGPGSIARGEFRASLRRRSQRAGLVEGKGMSVLGSLSYPFRGCSWGTVRSEATAYDEAKALEAPGQTPRRSDR